MATTECDFKHLIVSDARVSIRDNLFGANRLFRHRPVADWVALCFESLLLFFNKEELQAISPQTILNGFNLAHNSFNFIKILSGLFKIADAYGIFADVRFLTAEHSAPQILDDVFLAMMEDGYVHLLAAANGKI